MASVEHSQGYFAYVRQQFARNRLGVAALWVVVGIALLGAGADFLANDKPIIASYQNRVIFPIFKSYAVGLGLSQWNEWEVRADWRSLAYEWAVFPPVPYTAETIDPVVQRSKDRAPSMRHLLGTDDIGRDVLAGLIHGSRTALSIGFVAMGIALVIGIVLGVVAGYFGGWVDLVISRMIEIVISLPTFFLIITIVALVQDVVYAGRLLLIMAIIGLTNWTTVARLIRGEVLRIRALDYITAAEALGFSTLRILLYHVLPNAIAPVLVTAAFGIANAVLIESALSFLGFGVPPTVVTWGSMLFRARADVSAWWLGLFPGLMIFLTVSSYNLIGDALRDATDPRLRGTT
ncbi:MAG: ABC transporter permease [Bacteroidota bacterium]|nr:ABC transporter permease [Candidatus Kapabacteria bacterium]MCS7302063.1 ABC transporter permease [Candidatus Kapabacteria bacterium]MCX7936863.1 ABC transporter permease [Chlorobiota bacterium]MDW8074582.1 ABC transporter permease [Bacteroidota bacterium]MDW8270942.1 ABC transporter permease [Bacteroidota bacterium]